MQAWTSSPSAGASVTPNPISRCGSTPTCSGTMTARPLRPSTRHFANRLGSNWVAKDTVCSLGRMSKILVSLPFCRLGTLGRGVLNARSARSVFPQAPTVGFERNELATADLLAAKVDAQVSDSTAAIYMGRQNPRLAAMSPDKVFHPIYVAI